MKILSLRLRGAIGIKKGMGLDEVYLDLSRLSGLVAFSGDNGFGKTTVLDNLHPYRMLGSRSTALTNHFFLPDSEKEFVFEYRGDIYKTLIKINAEAKQKTSEAFIWKNDIPQVKGKNRDYDRYIEKLVMPSNLFFNSRFSAQKKKTVNEMDTADQRKLFGDYIGSHFYKAWHESAKKIIKALSGRIESVEADILRVSDKISEIDVTKESLQALKDYKISLEQDLIECNNVIANLNLQIKDLDEKKLENAVFENELKDLNKNLVDAESNKSKIFLENAKIITSLDAKISDLEDKLKTQTDLLKHKGIILKAVEDKKTLTDELKEVSDKHIEEQQKYSEENNSLKLLDMEKENILLDIKNEKNIPEIKFLSKELEDINLDLLQEELKTHQVKIDNCNKTIAEKEIVKTYEDKIIEKKNLLEELRSAKKDSDKELEDILKNHNDLSIKRAGLLQKMENIKEGQDEKVLSGQLKIILWFKNLLSNQPEQLTDLHLELKIRESSINDKLVIARSDNEKLSDDIYKEMSEIDKKILTPDNSVQDKNNVLSMDIDFSVSEINTLEAELKACENSIESAGKLLEEYVKQFEATEVVIRNASDKKVSIENNLTKLKENQTSALLRLEESLGEKEVLIEVSRLSLNKITVLGKELGIKREDIERNLETAERLAEKEAAVKAADKLALEFEENISDIKKDKAIKAVDFEEKEDLARKYIETLIGNVLEKEKEIVSDVDLRHSLVKDTLNSNLVRVDELKDSIRRCESNIEMDSAEFLIIEKDLELLEGYRSKKIDMEAHLSEWSKISIDCGQKGMPAIELANAAPVIEEGTNLLIHEAYDPGCSLELQTLDDEGKEVFEIIIIDPDGERVKFLDNNVGKQTYFMKALSLAMANEKAAEDCNTLWADEEESGLSSESVVKFMELFRAILATTNAHTVVYISHKEAAVAMADHTVNFEKDGIYIN